MATVPLYSSSIGQKIISALTGLFLCAFLIVHVAGNLLLFKGDNGQAFNAYAQSNAANLLIRSLEVVLFAGFLIHIIWGIRFWLMNRSARPQNYALNRPSENSPLFSRIMLLSGSIILLFLVVHLRNFWFRMRFPQEGEHISEFLIVKTSFEDPLYSGFYIAALVLLAYHLRQGFQAALQTFGIRPFWRTAIDRIAVFFWLIIPAVFATMPLYFLLKGAR